MPPEDNHQPQAPATAPEPGQEFMPQPQQSVEPKVEPVAGQANSETEFNPDNFETEHPEGETTSSQESLAPDASLTPAPELSREIPATEPIVTEVPAEVATAPVAEMPVSEPASIQAPQPELNKSGGGKKAVLVVLGIIVSLGVAAVVAFALMTLV
jgi:hypothetical protein